MSTYWRAVWRDYKQFRYRGWGRWESFVWAREWVVRYPR